MMFFFDTYAIIELIKGNPTYAKFQPNTIVTTLLNMAELYYYLLRESGKNKAEWMIHSLTPDLIEFDVEIIKNAMEFKHHNIKKKMSMVDCIGYTVARTHNMLFLTGDDAFNGLDDVEFVK